jgi:Fe-S-cluster-containing dehydrogenase component
MDTNRRGFLKIGGLCALGLGALPVVDALGKSDLPKVMNNPQALVGKRWAMVVDMKKCWEKGKPGCKDCILACHVTHNVPDIGSIKEEVKWLWTKATFKRADGITMMDFHRCIGCRYCMAGCPYGARSFNWKDPRNFIKTELNMTFPTRERGVVEKCNFCDERLGIGKIPACVEACKDGCLYFGDLQDPNSEVRKILASHFTIRRKPELGTDPSVYYII